jgi:hypothetical protein
MRKRNTKSSFVATLPEGKADMEENTLILISSDDEPTNKHCSRNYRAASIPVTFATVLDMFPDMATHT